MNGHCMVLGPRTDGRQEQHQGQVEISTLYIELVLVPCSDQCQFELGNCVLSSIVVVLWPGSMLLAREPYIEPWWRWNACILPCRLRLPERRILVDSIHFCTFALALDLYVRKSTTARTVKCKMHADGYWPLDTMHCYAVLESVPVLVPVQ